MKKVLLGFAVAALVGFGAYAADSAAAPAAGKTTINVLFDNGVTDKLEARRAKAQTEIGDFMKEDLPRVIDRYAKKGFEGKLIDRESDYKVGPGNELLKVVITNYNPGSKAARMVVGFGAGGVKLAAHYELFVDGKSIISKDEDVYSGRDWRNAARKVNENIAKEITAK